MPPVANANATALWKSNDPVLWLESSNRYETRSGEKFIKNDERKELHNEVIKEYPPLWIRRGYVMKEEYVKVVKYKLAKGKTRPSRLKYANETTSKLIEEMTKQAFKMCEECENLTDAHIDKIVKCLISPIKGCGAATGSRILSLYDSRFPFYSDEALAVVIGKGHGSDIYSLANYKQFCANIRIKRKILVNLKDLSSDLLSHSDLERALWSAATKK